MFWTAMIWGAGASCGAASGFLLFSILLRLLDFILPSKGAKSNTDHNERSIAALLDRNDKTDEMIVHLARLAAVAESMDKPESSEGDS